MQNHYYMVSQNGTIHQLQTCRVRSLKQTDIKLNTLKCSYNRLLMTIDRPLLHGVPLMSVLGLPYACLLANYFMGLIN